VLADSRRFWDLPWFFALMCLMAGAYHWSIVRSPVFVRTERAADGKPEASAARVAPIEAALHEIQRVPAVGG
jgi:hypothetical protein